MNSYPKQKISLPEFKVHNVLRVIIATISLKPSLTLTWINTNPGTKGLVEGNVCPFSRTKIIYLKSLMSYTRCSAFNKKGQGI